MNFLIACLGVLMIWVGWTAKLEFKWSTGFTLNVAWIFGVPLMVFGLWLLSKANIF